MKNKTTLTAAALVALLVTPGAFADEAKREVTGSRIKQLADIKVQNTVAPKVLQNADNSDLDAELQAILADAEAAEAGTE